VKSCCSQIAEQACLILSVWGLVYIFKLLNCYHSSQSHTVTDGQSVSLGVEPPSGAHDQIFIAV
jgi:hypothetical protein